MYETDDELNELQALLDASHGGATHHLRDIINDDRTLSAREVAGLMTGMRLLSVASVTRTGEPRISGLDGHFLHGRWTIGTSRSSAKARQFASRPATSAACLEGEDIAVFTHGQVEFLEEDHAAFAETVDHWTAHYGSSPLTWGDTVMMRIRPTWMVGYAFKRSDTLARRGVPEEPRPLR